MVTIHLYFLEDAGLDGESSSPIPSIVQSAWVLVLLALPIILHSLGLLLTATCLPRFSRLLHSRCLRIILAGNAILPILDPPLLQLLVLRRPLPLFDHTSCSATRDIESAEHIVLRSCICAINHILVPRALGEMPTFSASSSKQQCTTLNRFCILCRGSIDGCIHHHHPAQPPRALGWANGCRSSDCPVISVLLPKSKCNKERPRCELCAASGRTCPSSLKATNPPPRRRPLPAPPTRATVPTYPPPPPLTSPSRPAQLYSRNLARSPDRSAGPH